MTEKVEIYLGISSFIYCLEKLRKGYYMPNERSVLVDAVKQGARPFSFADYSSIRTDCGFIKTSVQALRDIFNNAELQEVLALCERKHNETTNMTAHCAVRNDPALKNNIPTSMGGIVLNCLYP